MLREAFITVTLATVALLVATPLTGAVALGPDAPAPVLVKHVMPLLTAATGDAPTAAPAAALDMTYHGGAIQKAPKVYLIFWGWNGIDPSGEAPYLISFFSGVGGSGWANIQTQYDGTGQGFITNPTGQLKGVWYDDLSIYPTVPDAFITNEVTRAVQHFGYDADANYVIATPTHRNDAGFANAVGGYCAWHSSVVTAGHKVAFTDLPYIPDGGSSCGANIVNPGAAGALDGVSIVAGHEYAEAVTDPHPASGWIDANGAENGDKCAWLRSGPGKMQNVHLSTGDFAVQGLWSNASHGCVISYP
jgi:serine protease